MCLLAGCASLPEPQAPPAREPVSPARADERVAPAPVVTRPASPAPERASGREPLAAQPETVKTMSRADFVARNDDNLVEVYVGMSRVSVERLMGNGLIGGWLNPTKRETVAGGRGAEYEVLFYLAREPAPGRAITDNLLTPVILHDDKVVSIGRYPLKKLRRTGCLSRGGPAACP